jgi:protein phosphatase
MPTGSIVILAVMVVALVAIYLLWRTSQPNPPVGKGSSSPSPEPPPEPSPVPVPARPETPAPVQSIPDLSGTLPKERDSDPEITMMGKVPAEVLALMQGKLSADVSVEVEEESYEIDVEELVSETAEEETTGKHALILVVGVARSDRGRKRQCNEDAFLILEDQHLYVVADGMGGHNAGEVASQKAVDAMGDCFQRKNFPGEPRPDWPRRGDELVRSIHHANQTVFELSQTQDDYNGMGTTVVAVRFSPNKQRAYIAHVGDSRCYRIRQGELHQLTEDHTLGRLMGATGKAAKHLAQAVGVRPDVAVDLTVDEPQPGDHYLICSDGLTKMVPDARLLEVATDDENLEQRCQELIAEANERGGRDNITVIMVRVESPTKEAKRVQDGEG